MVIQYIHQILLLYQLLIRQGNSIETGGLASTGNKGQWSTDPARFLLKPLQSFLPPDYFIHQNTKGVFAVLAMDELAHRLPVTIIPATT